MPTLSQCRKVWTIFLGGVPFHEIISSVGEIGITSIYKFLNSDLTASGKAGNKKKSNKGKAKKDKVGGTAGRRPHAKENTHTNGYAAMCAGYFKLVVGLKKDGKISVPASKFDNESVRYEHRFAPFNNLLTPPSMPYRWVMLPVPPACGCLFTSFSIMFFLQPIHGGVQPDG